MYHKTNTNILFRPAIIVLLISLTFYSYGQQASINLIPNPSFEKVLSDFSCPGFIGCGGIETSYCSFDWSKINNWSQPNRSNNSVFNSLGNAIWMSYYCNTQANNTYSGINYARTGTAWAEITAFVAEDSKDPVREDGDYGYIVSDLLQPLVTGHLYYIEFYVRPSAYVTYKNSYGCSFGAYFTLKKPEQHRDGRLKVTPDLQLPPATSTTYVNGWTKMSGFFTASNSYKWITIGTFDQTINGFNANYWIDDVKLVDVGTSSCPPQWLIENTTYTAINEPKIEASNSIVSGSNAGFSDVDGPVLVKAGSNVQYKAGHEIGLLPSFGAELGSTFHAYIAPCGKECFDLVPLSSGQGQEKVQSICLSDQNKCRQIGTPAQYNFTYNWSASPASAIDYLSDPNSSNPTVCLPDNLSGNGSITYTLTQGNSCGDQNSSDVIVSYGSKIKNSEPWMWTTATWINNHWIAGEIPPIQFSGWDPPFPFYYAFDARVPINTEELLVTFTYATGSNAGEVYKTYKLISGRDFILKPDNNFGSYMMVHFETGSDKFPHCYVYNVTHSVKVFCNPVYAVKNFHWVLDLTTYCTQNKKEQQIPIVANVSNASCGGANDGSISLTVGGGTAPYTYTWSNGAITKDLSNLTAGTYSVIVTDADHNTSTQTFTIIEPPVLTVSASVIPATCNGSNYNSVNLTVTGGKFPYTYTWSNGATTQNLNDLTAGTYSVIVTDAIGCTAESTITITNPSLFFSSAINTSVSCNGGNNGSINLSVTGGTAPYTYTWSNGATTEDLSSLAAGTYTATITDANACTTTMTEVITEPALFTATAVPVAVPCNGGNNGSINLTVAGGSVPYTYTWSDGTGTKDLSGLTASTYSVTVTDANGCTATADASITEPTAIQLTLSITNPNCGNSGSIDLTVTNGQAPYTYTWSNGATTQSLNNLSAGTYSVTVTDANSCTATADANISEPAAIQLTLSATNPGCGNNGTIDLTVIGGTAPYTYAWSNGANTEDVNNLPPGTYTVTVNDVNGCTATSTASLTSGVISSYNISSIPYSPNAYHGGTAVPLGDDAVSGSLPIGFSFCFFENTYTQFYIGSNGWISFSAGQTTAYRTVPIPDATNKSPKNVIMLPWQDLYSSGGKINYVLYGTAPFRKLVVSYDSIIIPCSYAHGFRYYQGQVVLYETSNVIENYIRVHDNTCNSMWGIGPLYGVQGIQNLTGTVAIVVPGRNNAQWISNSEGWRYTPDAGIILKMSDNTEDAATMQDGLSVNSVESKVIYYPNPATHELVVMVDNATTGNYELIITNLLGQKVAEKHFTGKTILDVSGIRPKGLYFIEVLKEGGTPISVEKLVLEE